MQESSFNRNLEISKILDEYSFRYSLKGYSLLRDAISIMVDHEEISSLSALYRLMSEQGFGSVYSLTPCINYAIERSKCVLAPKELIFSVACKIRNMEAS